ncbi:MAG: LamG domain-containing protein [Pirellulales bacterium]|nr:LamG domain-containing protein [Pirellulales bacterium]
MSKMHSSVVMLAVALLVILPAAVAQAETIGLWLFNEGDPGDQTTGQADEIIDYSGKGNHGYAAGNPLPYYAAADEGYDPPSAIRLTYGTVRANCDRIVVPHSSDFNLMFADEKDYTIEAFIKTSSTLSQTIFSKDVGWDSYTFRVDQSTGKLALYTQIGTGLSFYPDAKGNTSVRDGEWHHVAIVIDTNADPSLTSVTFYLDYEADGTVYFDDVTYQADWVNNNMVSDADVWIGDYATTSVTNQFVGDISMVRFSDAALTPDQFYVPEPSTFALLAAGLIGLLAYAWRKRK